MSPLRRVFGERAGPTALGILVPPGPRTVLILRPRSLPWDLLLTNPGGEEAPLLPLRELPRQEAEAVAEQLCHSLEEWAEGGPVRVEAVAAPGSAGYCVRAWAGPFPLIACPRRPREPYHPLIVSDEEDARTAATAIAAVLHPAVGSVQEVYFNTRNFSPDRGAP
jgi:hypothetical protein